MKILAINVLYYPFIGGGAELTIKDLYEGLANRGYDIYFLTLSDGNFCFDHINRVKVYREPIRNLYLPYFRNKSRPGQFKRVLWHLLDVYNPLSKAMLERYIDTLKPNVLICHNIQGFSPSVWTVGNSKSIPVLQVLHDLYIACPRNMFSRSNRACKELCVGAKMMRVPHKHLSSKINGVVGISNFVLQKLVSLGFFKSVPVRRVIYNSRKLSTGKRKPREYDGNLHLGFIGNIAPNKGIEVLLNAYLKVKHENTKLFIAGSGDEEYLEFLKQKYADDSVVWLGWMNREKFFELVDFVVVPSIWYEALGMVLVEAISFGIPVIASRVGGIPEIVVNGKNGLLFKAGNVEELCEKIEEAFRKVKLWKRSYEDIRKSVRIFVDYEEWLDKWENAIFSIL